MKKRAALGFVGVALFSGDVFASPQDAISDAESMRNGGNWRYEELVGDVADSARRGADQTAMDILELQLAQRGRMRMFGAIAGFLLQDRNQDSKRDIDTIERNLLGQE